MRSLYRLERLPLESREPVVSFAVIRLLIAGAAALALGILGFPYEGSVTAILCAVAVPWAAGLLLLARRKTEAALNPTVMLGDIAILGLLLAVEPELYAPVHFSALFFVAAHAHFQGGERSLLVGVVAPAVIVPVTLASDTPLDEGLAHGYEVVFTAACLLAALVVGALRTAESSGRLRARALSRRAIDTESEMRRRLAESIHDGPLQELSSVELMLASAEQALDHGDPVQGRRALREARELTRSNIVFLRDEIVELGPYAFEELSFAEAVGGCRETWQRRYGFTLSIDIDESGLAAEIAGSLFRITQEAVTNAGKHAGASKVSVRLTREDGGGRVLEVADDGSGFGDVDPLAAIEPGHLGLASIRERAEMLGGRLDIESGDGGTRVRVCL